MVHINSDNITYFPKAIYIIYLARVIRIIKTRGFEFEDTVQKNFWMGTMLLISRKAHSALGSYSSKVVRGFQKSWL